MPDLARLGSTVLVGAFHTKFVGVKSQAAIE